MRMVSLARGAAVALLAAGLLAASDLRRPGAEAAEDAAPRPLRALTWGGAYAEAMKRAVIDPFEAAHPGARVALLDYAVDAAGAEGQAAWDLADTPAAAAIRLCAEGQAAPLDRAALLAPGSDGAAPDADFGPVLGPNCFAPHSLLATVIAYRAAPDAPAPADLCALFDLDRHPGRRALEASPLLNLEWALLCDGVPVEAVYQTLETEAGRARAFKKLETIRRRTLWWRSAEEPALWLAEGRVALASLSHRRLAAAVQNGAPLAPIWDGRALDALGWVMAAGLDPERREAAERFLRFATAPERVAALAALSPFAAARRSSAPRWSGASALAPELPSSLEGAPRGFVIGYAFWASHRDDLDARFQAWLAE